MTAPLKGGIIEGGKIAGMKVIEKLLAQEAANIAANVGVRAISEVVAEKASKNNYGYGSQSSGKRGGKLNALSIQLIFLILFISVLQF